jgi:sucrose phosphorylase
MSKSSSCSTWSCGDSLHSPRCGGLFVERSWALAAFICPKPMRWCGCCGNCLQMIDPRIAIITETNVPNRENLSYFGNRNEAHMIYNFSLPPLVLNASDAGASRSYLKAVDDEYAARPHWLRLLQLHRLPRRHWAAPHRRPPHRMTNTIRAPRHDAVSLGGKHQHADVMPDGSESPYEINISLFDAMKGTVAGEDEWQIERFLCSQTIMMSLEGIPAFYIHSLLGHP